MTKRIFDISAYVIACAFLSIIILDILLPIFLNPDKNVLISEPNKYVSGFEVIIGTFSFVYLIFKIIERIQNGNRSN